MIDYLYIKAAHIVFVIAWMAGLLYLPRLFAYHAEAPVGGEASETFKTMERRLLRGIMNPAMLGVWVFGFWLVGLQGKALFDGKWFWVKFGLVIALTGFHMFLGSVRRKFYDDKRPFSIRFFRLINEAPAVIMVLVVILVVTRPF